MTALLASVACLEEVVTALESGVGILDLKDPSRGALGAWPVEALGPAVDMVGGRKPVSATVGDLPMEPGVLAAAVARTAAAGVDFIKVGFFDARGAPSGGAPSGGVRACLDALAREIRDGARIVAVLFADRKPDFAVIETLAGAGFEGVMLDTADKEAGSLRDHLDDGELARFVAAAAGCGLFSGLAGSLGPGDVGPLLGIGPDYMGFRGALCGGEDRRGRLDKRALENLLRLFHEGGSSRPRYATARAGAQSAARSLKSWPAASRSDPAISAKSI